VGKHHPQALIYPLTVASKSSSAARKNAALKIMDAMREHSATIVEQVIDPHPRWFCVDTQFPVQASIVSHELIRVAILWHELWHEGLEEASRLYFTERNPEGMVAVLEPLHDMIEAVCGFPFSRPDPD
jgi:FKBP12-rapamycin complex-associated protein